jgi:hypothetical protein
MRILCLIPLVAVGCASEEPPSVAFMSPAPGAAFTRDVLGETGALVADVPIQIDIGGDVARVAITRGDTEVGDTTDDGALTAHLRSTGDATLTATAYDAQGTVLATTSVDITIAEPKVDSCHAWLDLYKLDYTSGPANPGVADPITVKTPINGIEYRYNGSETPRKSLYGDCQLIKSLAEGAPIMREHDIVQFVDIGVYNYRCIDQSKTPPNCTMSQHAYAKAIDIAAIVTSDQTKYTVLTDWDIDPATTTCSAETSDDKDAFLHQVICALKKADVWNIVLTPNYNADHRNHFHVDLTEGADTIKREAAPTTNDPSLFDLRTATGIFGD